jgi:tetraacyldisaccharide 4'-kinase
MKALSAVYGGVARLRRSWYARRPHARRVLQRPVISVGNLVVGGSGKTPVVAALARLLLEAGERPAILSRGYARRGADPVVVVSDGTTTLATVEQAGDEPWMLAAALPTVPVVVSADRYRAGALAERQFGCTVHLLDDGFQHLHLARDVDLLLVQPEDLDDHVLPAGRLREPHDAATAADAVLVSASGEEAEAVAAALGVPTMFTLTPRFGAARWLSASPDGSTGPAAGKIVAVAGIARPNRFFDALRALGWDVVREIAFPDHHWFTDADHARIAAAVRESNADAVMTTEKDAARINGVGGKFKRTGPLDPTGLSSLNDLRPPFWAVLPMEMAIEPREAFVAWLLPRLVRHTQKGDGR